MSCKSCDHGMSSVTGAILITAIIVVFSIATYAMVGTYEIKEPVFANIDIQSINLSTCEVVLVHMGGDPVDVSQISIIISVNGRTLDKNLIELPVVGSVSGFYGALGGVLWGSPTNKSHDNFWDPGDKGDFKIAKSNVELHSGDLIKVTVVHRPTNSIISSPSYRI